MGGSKGKVSKATSATHYSAAAVSRESSASGRHAVTRLSSVSEVALRGSVLTVMVYVTGTPLAGSMDTCSLRGGGAKARPRETLVRPCHVTAARRRETKALVAGVSCSQAGPRWALGAWSSARGRLAEEAVGGKDGDAIELARGYVRVRNSARYVERALWWHAELVSWPRALTHAPDRARDRAPGPAYSSVANGCTVQRRKRHSGGGLLAARPEAVPAAARARVEVATRLS